MTSNYAVMLGALWLFATSPLASGADKDEPMIHGKRLKTIYDKAGLDTPFQFVEGAGHGGSRYRDAKRSRLILDLMGRRLSSE